MIAGINHVTFGVSNLNQSIAFYTQMLGCELAHAWASGAYLKAGDLWLCLSLVENVKVRDPDDYTHIAFHATQEAFVEARAKLAAAHVREWKQNSSEGDSVYFLDPDGHQLEIHVGTLESRLASLAQPGKGQRAASGCQT